MAQRGSTPRKHLTLLYDMGELAALLAGSADLESFLRRIVEMVAKHFDADVCSIYLYDDKRKLLTLRATRGLNPEAVGYVSLKLGEGLTGLALKELRPICEKCASRNPHYKRVPALGEEGYESFLAVPIHRGVDRIGVLVAQRGEQRPFTDDDVMALRAATMHLAGAIENARLLMNWRVHEPPRLADGQDMQLIRGKVASEGYAFGPALPLPPGGDPLILPAQPRPDFTCTLEDFHAALRATVAQLEELQGRLKERLAEAASMIFTAHLMMLKDSRFTGEMASRIQRGEAPHAAVLAVARYYIGLFSASPHAYLREKANDVEDLAKRILANLVRQPAAEQPERAGKVVIAAELHPSDVLWLASENVSGIVLVRGGLTAHVSIIARSLGIPLLIADRPDLLALAEGTPVLLDAEAGNVYVRPSAEVIARFKERERAKIEMRPALGAIRPETRSADGVRVKLMANINLLSEVRLAMDLQVDGIGLYRTEFPFLIRTAFPAEEEQLPVYTALLRQAGDKEVTIRTLDLGSDKLLLRSETREENPALGLRSTRFLLRHRDILGQQLRAILRAAADHKNLRILFPMISSLEEFREVRAEVNRAIDELRRSRLPCCENPAVGLMVEMPAAVEIIDDLAREADFLSIGTNDLIQYFLAVDRANDRVASYFLPHHPAVLRALRRVAEAAREREREITVCGEIAHDERLIPFLLGIGIRSLSMDPNHLLRAQTAIMSVTIAEAERLAEAILAESTVQGVERILATGKA